MYNLIFTDLDQGVVLFKYTIDGNEYTIMKRTTKLSIYMQVLLFSMNGIYTLFKDRKQELMIFATGHIYRETGHDTETDDGIEWRVKWAQRGTGVSFLLGMICWLAGQFFATMVFCILGTIFTVILYYKNFSFVIAKRLLREMNVVIILGLGLCNCVINIARPLYALEPVLGLIYMLAVSLFVFLDAVKVKSRTFAIAVGVVFVLTNTYNIYNYILGDVDQGVVIFKYSIHGNDYAFMKRTNKRLIYIQVLLFSMNGIYTLFKDRKQELMLFATGNIYRETGTASKEVEQKIICTKMIEPEKKSLSL